MNFKHLRYFWAAAKAGGVMRAGEQLHTTPQTLSGQINQLEEHDLLESRTNPRHKRSTVYALTEKGSATFQAVYRLHTGWANALADGLPAEHLQGALALLAELDRRLDIAAPKDGV